MMFPIHTDSPVRRRPWMNWAIVAVTVGVFIADWRFLDGRLMPRLQLDGGWPGLHEFVTYCFIHLSPVHLVGNMLVLLIFGPNVNDRLGHVGYLAFYLAAAVFAGAGFLSVSDGAVVGASGAVGAVVTAYLALLPSSRLIVHLHFTTLNLSATKVIIGLVGLSVVVSLSAAGGEGGSVAYQAHIAGMLFGFFMVLGLQGMGLLARRQPDFLSVFSHWNRRRVYRGLVARRGFDPFGATVEDSGEAAWPAPPVEPDPSLLRAAVLRAQVSEAVARRDLPEAARLFVQLKRIDASQFLPRQAQHDVATQLASEQHFGEAADAYEQFLRHYPSFEQVEQVQLMLGLIYARYLKRYARAKECLSEALRRLEKAEEVKLARAELERIEPMLGVARSV